MKKILCLMLLACLQAATFLLPARDFKIHDGKFLLDGKPLQLICGEMHYPRIPQEYWRDRIRRAKAMGINTVSTYVFWNIHERQPGVFDFKGQADLAKFVRTAQEEGMYVILRPGPYVCAEWDFGGYPYWLQKTVKWCTVVTTLIFWPLAGVTSTASGRSSVASPSPTAAHSARSGGKRVWFIQQ